MGVLLPRLPARTGRRCTACPARSECFLWQKVLFAEAASAGKAGIAENQETVLFIFNSPVRHGPFSPLTQSDSTFGVKITHPPSPAKRSRCGEERAGAARTALSRVSHGVAVLETHTRCQGPRLLLDASGQVPPWHPLLEAQPSEARGPSPSHPHGLSEGTHRSAHR